MHRGGPQGHERLVPNANEKFGQHGGCNEIPSGLVNGRIVFSTIRNPYELDVSQYEFEWWQRFPVVNGDIIKDVFPNYPDLSFPEYIKLRNTLFMNKIIYELPLKTDIGANTFQFTRFFLKSPYSFLSEISEETLMSKNYLKHMHKVKFLRTEKLNADLFQFLTEPGEPENKIEFIKNMKNCILLKGAKQTGNGGNSTTLKNLKNMYERRSGYCLKCFLNTIFNTQIYLSEAF